MSYHWKRTNRAGLAVAGLIGLMLVASSVSASPYPLGQIMEKTMADKLAKQKITTTTQLLEQGAKPKQRRALAKKAGIAAAKLNRWVNMCDLLRIKGVGPEMVRLLEAGGVKTVRKLKAQKAARLHPRLIKANGKAKVTANPPTAQQIEAWIDQAKKLAPVLR